MSTANGGRLAIASVISRNILQRNILRKLKQKGHGLNDRQLLLATRLLVIPMFFAAFALGALIPRPGIYLILAFDIVFAGCRSFGLGTYWKKSTPQAAIASIVVGSTLRLILYFVISTATPDSPYFPYLGLDTFIPPLVSLALFVVISYATYKKKSIQARCYILNPFRGGRS